MGEQCSVVHNIPRNMVYRGVVYRGMAVNKIIKSKQMKNRNYQYNFRFGQHKHKILHKIINRNLITRDDNMKIIKFVKILKIIMGFYRFRKNS